MHHKHLPFGFAYDLFEGYKEILYLTMILPGGFAIISSLLAPKPVK